MKNILLLFLMLCSTILVAQKPTIYKSIPLNFQKRNVSNTIIITDTSYTNIDFTSHLSKIKLCNDKLLINEVKFNVRKIGVINGVIEGQVYLDKWVTFCYSEHSLTIINGFNVIKYTNFKYTKI